VFVHWSFWLLVVGAAAYGGLHRGVSGVLVGTLAMLGLAVSVILHELGHALAGLRFGVGTEHITLYPFGGIAAMERMPEDPDQETIIALAGPATNFLLAAIGGWVWMFTHSPWAMVAAVSNAGMGAFNLIPAFPMDGGRILRATLARRMGWLPASRLSVKIGRVFAWGFIVLGLVRFMPSLVLLGGMLLVALRAEHNHLVRVHWERTVRASPVPSVYRSAP